MQPPRNGDKLTPDILRRMKALILQTVKGGPGILVKRVGESVVVEATGQQGGKPASGAAQGWVTATTKAGLVDPPNNRYLARVDGSGSDDGMVCIANPDGSGWDAINFFE
jgi:hypothetical protein